MDFKSEKVYDFLKLFDAIKDKIANYLGCTHLELCKDAKLDHVFYTCSHWESEESLENYRDSELFRKTWIKIKVLFREKPLAYSLLQR